MKKSRFCKIKRIKENVYVIYNNLLMEPIYVDYKTATMIKYNKLSKLSSEKKKELQQYGILIEDDIQDIKAYKVLKNEINKEIKNKISIMYIIPNSNCNLMCKYCFIGKLNNKRPEKMTLDTMKNAVDKFAKYAKKQDFPCKIIFYGGEPLISFENIKKIVEYIYNNKYNFELAMVTNGTIINDEIIKFLKDYKIELGISLDGPKNINDKNRIYYNNINNSVYDTVVTNIQKLNSADITYGLSITISDALLKQQDEFLKWLQSLKVKSFSYNMMHYTEPTNKWKQYYLDVTKFLIKSNDIMFPKGYSEDRIKRKYSALYDRDFKYSDCAARGGNQFAIKPNGDIVICHGYWNTPENRIGNINTIESVEKICQTQRYNDWYRNIPINKKKCINCEALYTCGGGCAMQSRDVFNNEKNIDKAFCIHSKYLQNYLLTELFNEDIKHI